MSTFTLEIVTPERKVYEDQVNLVVVKGQEGELGILPNHIPLVTPIKISAVRIKKEKVEEIIAVSGGFLEIRKDKVVILAETAEKPEDINLERAEAAKQRAQERLQASKDAIDHARAELSLQRALNRINIKVK